MNVFKILKYVLQDLIRSRWSYAYLGFYLILSSALLTLNNNFTITLITLMNITVIMVPLIGTIFGVMYYYESKEFIKMLLAHPINRTSIFLGEYCGVAISLSLSIVIGIGLPFLIYGIWLYDAVWNFLLLLAMAVFLTFIFVAIAFNIALLNDNKIKGFSYAIFFWLFMSVIYDGIFLIFLMIWHDYPLESVTLFMTFLNPIDLARIIITLQFDISALMGYTGATIKHFIGSSWGILISGFTIILWVIIPTSLIKRISNKKDF